MPMDKTHGADLVASKILRAKYYSTICDCPEFVRDA